MAQLHHILGSIFRDIAQARMTADIYSRNISQYYEQDPLLRRFPAPRTDVQEVEVDLKFILSGFEVNPAQEEGRESSTATVLVDVSHAIAEDFFNGISRAVATRTDVPEAVRRNLEGLEYRIYQRQDLLVYFQRNRDRLIKDGKFLYKEALGPVEKSLAKGFQRIFAESGFAGDVLENIEKQALEIANVESRLKSICDPIHQAWKAEGDIKVSVEVTADKLQDVRESAVCSIKVKADVRNYVWSKVDHEGRTWYELNPE